VPSPLPPQEPSLKLPQPPEKTKEVCT
jgi:hypothetical protein